MQITQLTRHVTKVIDSDGLTWYIKYLGTDSTYPFEVYRSKDEMQYGEYEYQCDSMNEALANIE